MADKEFDPNKFIDRDFEQTLFEELLRDDQARILAICDGGGMGKTQLLQKFQHRCSSARPRIPVTLISPDDLKPHQSPLSLVARIAQELTDSFNVQFPNFDLYYSAQTSGDFDAFRSSVNLQGSDFRLARDVRISARQTNIDNAKVVNISTSGLEKLTPEQQELANRVCVRAFFDDLKVCCSSTPIVVILDAFEKCDDALKKWFIESFLERQFFNLDTRPARFVLVVAGRKIPAFESKWPLRDVETFVRSVKQLGKWKRNHVEECLRAHGFTYTPAELDLFHSMIELGLPPSQVVQSMETLAANRR